MRGITFKSKLLEDGSLYCPERIINKLQAENILTFDITIKNSKDEELEVPEDDILQLMKAQGMSREEAVEFLQIGSAFANDPDIEKEMKELRMVDGELLKQIVIEAIQIWLKKKQEDTIEKEEILQLLRESGLIMDRERQRTLTEAMMNSLSLESIPDRTKVEASLKKLRIPLSEEIIAMRGEQ